MKVQTRCEASWRQKRRLQLARPGTRFEGLRGAERTRSAGTAQNCSVHWDSATQNSCRARGPQPQSLPARHRDWIETNRLSKRGWGSRLIVAVSADSTSCLLNNSISISTSTMVLY